MERMTSFSMQPDTQKPNENQQDSRVASSGFSGPTYSVEYAGNVELKHPFVSNNHRYTEWCAACGEYIDSPVHRE
jgi:hypothetical protein